MRKMRLTIDALQVETFQTARTGMANGTVRGNNVYTQQGADTDCTCGVDHTKTPCGCLEPVTDAGVTCPINICR